jgi:hypothetical protein
MRKRHGNTKFRVFCLIPDCCVTGVCGGIGTPRHLAKQLYSQQYSPFGRAKVLNEPVPDTQLEPDRGTGPLEPGCKLSLYRRPLFVEERAKGRFAVNLGPHYSVPSASKRELAADTRTEHQFVPGRATWSGRIVKGPKVDSNLACVCKQAAIAGG